MQDYPVNMLMGASSLGKSFNAIIFLLLDWSRDAENTNYKVISVSETHAQANVWSTLSAYHSESLIPLPGKAGAESIRLTTSNLQSAISLIAIPQGEDGKGRLQGFHPLPRSSSHPVFGELTRVGLYVDEAEKCPVGIWDGIDNLISSQTPYKSVRITLATNPADIASTFAHRAEPVRGWTDFDEDKDFEWESNFGYHVLRLDAKYSENVLQKKHVFFGLQTFEGFSSLEKQGITSVNYMTFGRGAYPREGIEYAIVPPVYLKDAKNEFIWTSMPFNLGSIDPAFAAGGNEPLLTIGRAGMAAGTTSGLKFAEPRFCALVDQQIALPKKNPLIMAEELIDTLRRLHVRPEWFCLDMTGNGLVFHGILKEKFGDILGVQWSGQSTDKKIIDENEMLANERYKDLISEMWFSTALWLEYGYLKFSPFIDTRILFTELTSRRSKQGYPYKVEHKETYVKRTRADSCDRADSLVLFVHLCRMRGMNSISTIPQLKSGDGFDFLDRRQDLANLKHDTIDFIEII
jgi:hypothetical protein